MTLDKPVVLIVDDAPTNIDLLRNMLGDQYKTKGAINGDKALKIAQTQPSPDLILLDILMPGLSGFDVCEALKSNPATQGIPVIFVTGTATEAEVQRAAQLGALGVYTKPLNPDQILPAVASAIHARP